MAKYVIAGGKKLKGRVKVSGNKNSVFPLLSAALLTDEEVVIKNAPKIFDTQVSVQILKALGLEANFTNGSIKVCAKKVNSTQLPKDLTRKLRGSIVFAGGLLGRFGRVEFVHPGGDVIGKRSIDTHIEGLHALGFDFEKRGDSYKVFGSKKGGRLSVFLEEPSVTATENLILASVVGSSTVIVKNCAKEPHIVDLCRLLNKMGAKIKGLGESSLSINGVSQLKGASITLGGDYLEFGTYAIAAAVTGGEIEVEGINYEDIEPIIYPLTKMGIVTKTSKSAIKVYADTLLATPRLKTNVWPGFPTDMMSVTIVLATQTKGVSLLHDWMYESRMFFVDKLISMGANITICDPHRVVVYGPTRLYGKELETPDIRAGMALVLAALTAEGESIINRAELIERGYEDVVSKLASLGAEIKREG